MIHSLKETGDSRYIYQNGPNKTCFKHSMAYGDFNDLNKRTVADKALRDKQFNIAKYSKYDAYQRGLGSTVYKFFDEKISGEIISNKELVAELHKPVIRKLEKRKLYSPFIENICCANLADV